LRKNKLEGKIPNSGRKNKLEGNFVKMNIEIREEYAKKLKSGYKKGILDVALKMYFDSEEQAIPT